MKVVLATLNAKYIHTSLALRCLKAYSEHEFDIDIAEYTIKDPVMNIVSDLYARRPDVVGFSCYIWNIEETITVIDMLRKVLPDAKIVLGGPEVSYDTGFWMERVPQVDFIVVGEGEETFHHLLTELRDAGKFHMVFGLAYRKRRADGIAEAIVNPPRPKLDLATLPSPHRFPEDVAGLASRVTYFETSRGCPFSCQFCLSSIEVGVRYFDMERTKADLLYLIESGAKLIKFVDRTFNIKRDYALEIFRFLIDNHRGCVFQFEITADIMRPEVLDFLAEHAPPGIFRFEIGVQSTNDPTNAEVQRRQNFAKLTRTVTKVKESGKIDQHLDLIAGLPLEDYDTFRKTFNDVFALRPEELQLGFLKMLRGTGMRRDADKHGYIYMDRAPYEILGNDLLPFSDIVRIKRVEDVLEKYWNAHRMDRALLYLIERVFPSAFDFFQQFGDYWEERGWQKIGHQLEDLFSRLWAFLTDTLGGAAVPAAGDRGGWRPDVALGLLKLDYFLGHRYKPRKIWWAFTMDKPALTGWMRLLAERPQEAASVLRPAAASAAGGGGESGHAAEAAGDGKALVHPAASVGDGGEPGREPARADAAAASVERNDIVTLAALGLGEKELHKHAVVERIPFDLRLYLEKGVILAESESLLAVVYGASGGKDGATPEAAPFVLTLSGLRQSAGG